MSTTRSILVDEKYNIIGQFHETYLTPSEQVVTIRMLAMKLGFFDAEKMIAKLEGHAPDNSIIRDSTHPQHYEF